MRTIPCIICPLYCSIEVRSAKESVAVVAGHKCIRGKAYAEAELTQPMRTLTTSIPIHGGTHEMASVRTSAPISLSMFSAAMDTLKRSVLEAPVFLGDCLVDNLCGTGSKVIATRTVNVEN